MAGPFDASAVLCRVDAKARICVRQSYYSVPARYAGRRLQVRLGARTITALAEGKVVAEHVRSLHKYSEDLLLDHYLEVLTRKPGALPGATALVQARAAGTFTTAHQGFWDAARRAGGDREGTRALVGVLLLHRTLPVAAITAGIAAALAAGRYDPDLVAVEGRRHHSAAAAEAVEVPGRVPADTRPVPSLTGYDTLLALGAGA